MFYVTDARDKIYGTLGLLDESVQDFLKADKKSIAETYTEAMTYMFNVEAERYNLEALTMFLEYPCSLSLLPPKRISDLLSWVPDFFQNHPLLDYTFDHTWFWLYQITRIDGRKPLVKL
jgi:hypothetical protein